MRLLSRWAFIVMLALTASSHAEAADIPGSSDHPLIGRYDGAEIVGYRVVEFDEASIVDGPFDPLQASDQRGPGFRRLTGKDTLIYYRLPTGRSTLEVQRNYEAALAAKSFRLIFLCNNADGSCFESGSAEGGYLVGSAIGDPLRLPRLSDDYVHNWFQERGRYLLAVLDRPEGSVYASISLGDSNQGAVAVVRVIESKEMDSGKIVVLSAPEMQKALEAKRSVNVYGIQFDFNKDVPRPESAPVLEQIATLLRNEAQLRLKVVGHTDNRGAAAYNLDLSRRRAAGVVAALVKQFGITADRLTSDGAGAGSPVAANDNDSGRAQNRRVELIAQ